MRTFLILLACFLAACSGGTGAGVVDDPGPAGEPRTLSARDVPAKVSELLAATETDSCGICVREKQEDAIAIGGDLFAPGNFVVPTPGNELRRLEGGDMELYFGAPDETAPAVSFRFHSVDENLVGIRREDFSDSTLVAKVLASEPGVPLDVQLEVIRFEYGDAPAIHFDEHLNRLQVQCKLLPAP